MVECVVLFLVGKFVNNFDQDLRKEANWSSESTFSASSYC